MEIGQDFNPFRKFTGYFVPECLLSYDGISTGAKLCLAVMYRYLGNNEVAWPGQEAIAKRMGCGERTVRGYISELETDGFIRSQQLGMGQANLYFARWHRIFEEEEGGTVAGLDRKDPAGQDRNKRSAPSYSTEESQGKESTPTNRQVPSEEQPHSSEDLDAFSNEEVWQGIVAQWKVSNKGNPPKSWRAAVRGGNFSGYGTLAEAIEGAWRMLRSSGSTVGTAFDRPRYSQNRPRTAPPPPPALPAVQETVESFVASKPPHFRKFMGLFAATGKTQQIRKVRAAWAIWESLCEDWQMKSIRRAEVKLPPTEMQYVPSPDNFLIEEPWNDMQIDRLLPAAPVSRKKTIEEIHAGTRKIAYERAVARARGEIVL